MNPISPHTAPSDTVKSVFLRLTAIRTSHCGTPQDDFADNFLDGMTEFGVESP